MALAMPMATKPIDATASIRVNPRKERLGARVLYPLFIAPRVPFLLGNIWKGIVDDSDRSAGIDEQRNGAPLRVEFNSASLRFTVGIEPNLPFAGGGVRLFDPKGGAGHAFGKRDPAFFRGVPGVDVRALDDQASRAVLEPNGSSLPIADGTSPGLHQEVSGLREELADRPTPPFAHEVRHDGSRKHRQDRDHHGQFDEREAVLIVLR